MGQESGLGLPDFCDEGFPWGQSHLKDRLEQEEASKLMLDSGRLLGFPGFATDNSFCHLGQFTRWQLSFLEGNAEESKREEGWQEKQDKYKARTFFLKDYFMCMGVFFCLVCVCGVCVRITCMSGAHGCWKKASDLLNDETVVSHTRVLRIKPRSCA